MLRKSVMRKTGIWFLLVSLLISMSMEFGMMALPVEAATQTTIYISPTGSDTGGNGSIDNPYATLQKARDVVRTMNSNMTGDIIVYLRGGTYTLSSPLALNESDSGTNGYNVIYKAYGTEKPVISGGKKVTGWSLHQGNIYKASVDEPYIRQLFVNDQYRQRARTGGKVYATAFYNDPSTSDATDGWVLDQSALKSWGIFKKSDLEAHVQTYHRDLILKIDDVIQNGSSYNLRAKQPWFTSITHMVPNYIDLTYDVPFYLENDLSLLDTPGEWYYDRAGKVLYYWPKEGENVSTMEAYVPDAEMLISLKGSSLTSKVHNIQFYGINFRHTTWHAVNENGVAEWQADWLEVPKYNGRNNPPGALWLENASYIKFERNNFANLSYVAIAMPNAVSNVDIIGNTFRDIAESPIYYSVDNLYNVDAAGEEIVKNLTIKNNLMYDFGREFYTASAVMGFYGENVNISHNYIRNSPNCGISVGWGWNYQPNTTAKNNTINYNRIENYMQRLNDGGGIYTIGNDSNSGASYNYLKGDHKNWAALYHDDSSTNWNDQTNVIEGSHQWLHLWTNTIKNITINNTYTTTSNIRNDADPSCNITNTHVIPDANWPAEAGNVITNAGLEAAYKDLLDVLPGTCANYAKGKTVTVSSNAANAANITDGTFMTVWKSTANNGQYAYVDLGSSKNFNKIVLKWDEVEYATGYNIQTSDNASAWTNIYSTTVGGGGNEEIRFPMTSGRYVRVNFTERANQYYGAGISELEVSDTTTSQGGGSNDSQAPTAPTNLTLTGKTDSTISISWTAATDNVGVTGYDIYNGSSLLTSSSSTSCTVTGLQPNTSYSLSVKARDANYNQSGASNQLNVTTNCRNPYIKQEAENYDSMSGIQTEDCTDTGGGKNVGWTDHGDWVCYKAMDFGSTGATSFKARVASNGAGGNIEIRLDSATGPLVGTCTVPVTGGWQTWVDAECTVGSATGVHDVYLVFVKAGATYLFNINWFQFYSSSVTTPTPTPTPTPTSTPTPTPTSGNIALGKTVTASSSLSNYPRENVNDNKTDTPWVSTWAPNQWVCVDLGAAYAFSKVEMVDRNGNVENRRNFAIQASNSSNFSSYVTLGSVGSTAIAGGSTFTANVTDTTAYRYVRYYKTEDNEGAVAELRIYGSTPTPTPTPANIAVGKTVTASSSLSNYPKENANDNKPNTPWVSTWAPNQWVCVDLGAAYTLRKVEMVDRNGNVENRRNFAIQASNDSSFTNCVTLGSVGSAGIAGGSIFTVNITDTTAYRYVRYYKTVDWEGAVAELRVYGRT